MDVKAVWSFGRVNITSGSTRDTVGNVTSYPVPIFSLVFGLVSTANGSASVPVP